MWRIKTTKDGVWLGRWILHSATQFHPFSTLPWDDQYPLHHRAIDQSLREGKAYFPTRGLQKFHPVGIRAARQNHNRSFAPPRSEWLVRIGQGDPLSSAPSESAAISSARA